MARTQQVVPPDGRLTTTVLGADGLSPGPVEEFPSSIYAFMFDEREAAAEQTGDHRWLDLTAAYTNLWRPYDNDFDHGRALAGLRHAPRSVTQAG